MTHRTPVHLFCVAIGVVPARVAFWAGGLVLALAGVAWAQGSGPASPPAAPPASLEPAAPARAGLANIRMEVPRPVKALTAALGPSRQRLALVVGNGRVGNRTVLDTASRDSQAVAALLRKLGFVVMLREDSTSAQLRLALAEFRERLQPGGVGFVYVTGLGTQIAGQNLLLGRDVALDESAPAERLAEAVKAASVSLTDVTDALMSGLDSPRLLVVDAAYAHPVLARLPAKGLTEQKLPPGMVALFGNGLNSVRDVTAAAPLPTPAPDDPREIAASGFARVLVATLATPRLSGPQALRVIRKALHEGSAGQWSPWLGGEGNDKEELAEMTLLDAVMPRTPEEWARELAKQGGRAVLRGGEGGLAVRAGEQSVSDVLNASTSPSGPAGQAGPATPSTPPGASRSGSNTGEGGRAPRGSDTTDATGNSQRQPNLGDGVRQAGNAVGNAGQALGGAAAAAGTVAQVAAGVATTAATAAVVAKAAEASVAVSAAGAAANAAGSLAANAVALGSRMVSSSSGTASVEPGARALSAAAAGTGRATAPSVAVANAAPAALAQTPLPVAAPVSTPVIAAPAAVAAPPVTPVSATPLATPPAAAPAAAPAPTPAATPAAAPASALPAARAGEQTVAEVLSSNGPNPGLPSGNPPPPARPGGPPPTDGRTNRQAEGGERPAWAPRTNRFGHAEGDTFVYQVTDTWKGEVRENLVTSIEEVLGDGQLLANGAQLQMDPQGRTKLRRGRDGSSSEFEPHEDLWWADPKRGQGRDVSFTERFTRADGARGTTEWRGSASVGRPRTIETPAGSFEVMPIETSGWATEMLASGQRSTVKFTRTVWYSPKLGQPVAIDIHDADRVGKLLRRERIELMQQQSQRLAAQ